MTPQEAQELREAIKRKEHGVGKHPQQIFDAETILQAAARLLALHDAGELQGWMPIESARRDGTEVLVWMDVATVPVVHIAFYRGKKEWEESGQYCGFCETLEEWEGWWSYTRGSVTQEKLEGFKAPTHWRPYNPPQPVSDPYKLPQCKRCQGTGRWGPDETPDAYECDECQGKGVKP